MRVVMAAVISKNRLLTDGMKQPSQWASKEDQDFFRELKATFPVIIMGRKTYDPIEKQLQNDGIKRIVLTHRPLVSSSPNIESYSGALSELIDRLSADYDSCLLLGGGDIYGQAMKNKLIDEAYVTIEPVIFETGTQLFGSYPYDLPKDKIVSRKILNKRGTELVLYKLKG